MPLIHPDEFGDVPCARIYIAGRLREAQHVERVLSEAGIDYFVEIEKFRKYLLGVIPREYNGVAFYVAAEAAERSRQVLAGARLRTGLTEDDEDEEGAGPTG
jgi:hypothetical protein